MTVYPRRSANRVPNRSLSQAAHGAHLYLTPWSSCRIPGKSSSPPGEKREPCSKTITPWTGEKWEGIIRARIRSALLWCLPIFLQTIQGMIVLLTKSLIHTLGDEVLAGGSASRTRVESSMYTHLISILDVTSIFSVDQHRYRAVEKVPVWCRRFIKTTKCPHRQTSTRIYRELTSLLEARPLRNTRMIGGALPLSQPRAPPARRTQSTKASAACVVTPFTGGAIRQSLMFVDRRRLPPRRDRDMHIAHIATMQTATLAVLLIAMGGEGASSQASFSFTTHEAVRQQQQRRARARKPKARGKPFQ